MEFGSVTLKINNQHTHEHAVLCRAGADPGRAVAGGVRWGVRGVCAGGVGGSADRSN
jgi:hypothetical protein